MFEAPVRKDIQGIQGFYVKLKEHRPLHVRFEVLSTGIVPELRYQSHFLSLQTIMISELVKNTQLFKVAPTLESLQSITPNWGFLSIDGSPKQSEYTQIDISTVGKDPCFADLVLVGVSITRSTIRPYFEAKFLEPVSDSVIDFQWESAEVEEVSDIGGCADSNAIQLRDPAAVEREKILEKERIRDALRGLKADAEAMVEAFHDKYDLSDSESAFTGWMSDSSDSSDSSKEDELP